MKQIKIGDIVTVRYKCGLFSFIKKDKNFYICQKLDNDKIYVFRKETISLAKQYEIKNFISVNLKLNLIENYLVEL